MAVTVRQLEVFATVARLGSVTRGAERLHLTQSAASMSLRQLERALDGPLFARVGRGLVLNDRGRALLPRVESLLAELAELEEVGRGAGSAPAGELLIGCSTTIGNYLMPALIKAFNDSYVNVVVHLGVGLTDEVATALCNGLVDGGLVEGEVADPRLRVEPWLRDELVCIAAPGSPLASRDEMTAVELADRPLGAARTGLGTRSTVAAAFAREGLRLAHGYELGPTPAVKSAVAAGMGRAASRVPPSRWSSPAGRLSKCARRCTSNAGFTF